MDEICGGATRKCTGQRLTFPSVGRFLYSFFPGNEEPNSQVERFDTGPTTYVCVGRVGVDCNRRYQLGAREIALSYLLARACVLSILDFDRDVSSRRGIHSGKKQVNGLTGSGEGSDDMQKDLPTSRCRWRGRRFACYAPRVMPRRNVSNCGSRTCSFSKYRKTNRLQMGEKIEFP